MITDKVALVLSTHPLGPLAGLAALAQEWHTRDRGLGGTWAGLWHPTQEAEILAVVAEHAQRMDDATMRLARQGALPGVRDYSLLWALLPTEPEGLSCVDSTTENSEALDDRCADASREGAADKDEDATIAGIPIWHHGVLEQAKLSPVRHAVHLVRHLDDYHEPTVAAQKRQRLRRLGDADPEKHAQICQEVAETFLAEPTRWRDVVEMAVYLAAVRECEQALSQRISGPGRTKEQMHIKLESGLIALVLGRATAIADRISTQFRARLERLRLAKVVLLYEEREYLQLTGVQAGRSVRRHLPRGLHLIFSDQHHRRADRTAGLWLEQSNEMHQAGSYHFAETVPLAYTAARKQGIYFRLPDADAVRRYVESERENNVA